MKSEILLVLIHCIVVLAFLRSYLKATPVDLKIWLVSFTVFKLAFALLLWVIYTYIYRDFEMSDLFKFFEDGKALNQIALQDPKLYLEILTGFYELDSRSTFALDNMNHWFKPYNYGLFNDNQTVIRINSVIHFLSLGSYAVHALYFNLMVLISLFETIKSLENRNSLSGRALLIVLAISPSFLIWTGGGLKEAVLMFALFLFVDGLSEISNHSFNPRIVFKLVLSSFFLVQIKTYVLLALCPLILWSFTVFIIKKNGWRIATFSILMFIGLLLTGTFNEPIMLDIISKQKDFINVSANGLAGSYFIIPELNASVMTFLKAMPTALLNSMFRPFPWDSHNFLALASSIENGVYIALIAFLLLNQKPNRQLQMIVFKILLILAAILIMTLAGLITPVAGALVRYVMPAKILILIALIKDIDMHKVSAYFKRIGLASFALFLMSSCVKTETADFVLHNGSIHSMNHNDEIFEAMAIENGVIKAIGKQHEILNKYDAKIYRDLKKSSVYPSFTDAHCYFIQTLLEKRFIDLNKIGNADSVVKIIGLSVQNKDDQTYLYFVNLNNDIDFNMQLMAKLKNWDVPIVLVHEDGLTATVNQWAAQMVKIKQDENWKVYNHNQIEKIKQIKDLYSQEVYAEEAIKAHEEIWLSQGFTSVANLWLSRSEVELLEQLDKNGLLRLNVVGYLEYSRENIEYTLGLDSTYFKGNFRLGGVDFRIDGGFLNRKAWMNEDMIDTLLIKELETCCKLCDLSGLQLLTQAFGPAAINSCLNSMCKFTEGKDLRWRIENFQYPLKDDILLAKTCNIIPGIQILQRDYDLTRLGQDDSLENFNSMYPVKNLLSSGLMISCGSSYAINKVESNKMLNEFTSSIHTDYKNTIIFEEALKILTVNNSIAIKENHQHGQLDTGMLANFVICQSDLKRQVKNSNLSNTYEVYIKGNRVH